MTTIVHLNGKEGDTIIINGAMFDARSFVELAKAALENSSVKADPVFRVKHRTAIKGVKALEPVFLGGVTTETPEVDGSERLDVEVTQPDTETLP